MNEKIATAFEQIEKKSKVDVLMTRIRVVLSYADENNMLDDIINAVDACLSSALYTIDNKNANDECSE